MQLANYIELKIGTDRRMVMVLKEVNFIRAKILIAHIIP